MIKKSYFDKLKNFVEHNEKFHNDSHIVLDPRGDQEDKWNNQNILLQYRFHKIQSKLQFFLLLFILWWFFKVAFNHNSIERKPNRKEEKKP